MSDATLILRCTLVSAENDWQHGTIEAAMGTPEASELVARFADQQPIMLSGRTFRVEGYEIIANEASGPPAGWQSETETEHDRAAHTMRLAEAIGSMVMGLGESKE